MTNRKRPTRVSGTAKALRVWKAGSRVQFVSQERTHETASKVQDYNKESLEPDEWFRGYVNVHGVPDRATQRHLRHWWAEHMWAKHQVRVLLLEVAEELRQELCSGHLSFATWAGLQEAAKACLASKCELICQCVDSPDAQEDVHRAAREQLNTSFQERKEAWLRLL